MLARQTCELRMETLTSKAVFKKYLELNHRGRIELRARKDKHRGSLCCAAIHRSAVVDPVPPKILAACALFLRRNHLRLVLFNTRVQSCHEKFDRTRERNVRVGGKHYAYIMFIISEDFNLAQI